LCKRIPNVKTSTSTLAIYSELGRYPLYLGSVVHPLVHLGTIGSAVPLSIGALLYKAPLY